MRNQELIQTNELNKNSNGGTELTTRRLYDFLDPEDLEGVQIITSRVRDLEEGKKRILHLHDLPGDPESLHLADENLRNRFDKIVFSSHWQYQQFRDQLGVPYDSRCVVIETGIDPLQFREKPKDKIRLIYTSTPHRGLELLVPVFMELAKHHNDIHLDVYSSFGIYGWEERDKPYEPLFGAIKEHPQMTYHGWQPNDVVRAAYEDAHIFAYPCIWQETSCRSLIEAMSAGCLSVHPNYSALPETSGGLTHMYNGTDNRLEHMHIFANALHNAIINFRHDDWSDGLRYIKSYADAKHSWQGIGVKWKQLLREVKNG